MILKSGKFIVLEGGEGVGKSTNLTFIKRSLEDQGIEVVQTREPGGTAMGEKIRALLLDQQNVQSIANDTELLLLFAARAQHLEEVIQPALRTGKWVLSDRFIDATYAYQGGGRGIPAQRIDSLVAWLQPAFFPDLILLLDAPIELGMQRVANRSEKDRFEREKHEFFERVRAAYLARAKLSPERYFIIDAAQPLATVHTDIAQVLHRFILN